MEPQTLELHGIKTPASKSQLEADLQREQQKNLSLREMVGLHHGQPVQGGESILHGFDRRGLEAAQYLADYLAAQEDGGGRTLDAVFQDARSFEDLARQTSLIGQLMAELHDLANTDQDFTGRREALSMLGDLSLMLKKTARIAAGKGGRLTTW